MSSASAFAFSPNASPRSAAGFVRRWDIPDAHSLIEGNHLFTDVYARQHKLVGQVLDACMILHVSERLKKHARIDNLGFFFPKKLSTYETAILKGEAIGIKPEDVDTARLKLLVEMSQQPGAHRKFKSHRDLASDAAWNMYKDEMERYKQEVDNRPFMPPPLPDDPRIRAVSERISGTIQILNSGVKCHDSIEGKIERKGGISIKDIRDINRIGVLPVSPQYAKEFIRIMGMLNPRKTFVNPSGENIALARTYEELPRVFSNGYYDQKMFVAMDQQRDNRGPTRCREATIAEVKIVPAAMDKATKLSAVIKPLREQLWKQSYYSSDAKSQKGVTNATIEARRAQLEELYYKHKSEFDLITQKHKKTEYTFPSFPKKNLHRADTYTGFEKQLLDLTRRIHVDAILAENREWQLEYLNTAVFQRLCRHDPEFKARTETVQPVEIKPEELLDPQSIDRLAKSGKFDLREIERDLKSKLPPPYVKPAAIG